VVSFLVARSRRAARRAAPVTRSRRHLVRRTAHREAHAGDPLARARRAEADPSDPGWLRLSGGVPALEWIANGFAHPEAAELWDAESLHPEAAGEWRPITRPRLALAWIDEGFSAVEAAAWLAVDCDDPVEAARLRDAGIGPAEVRADLAAARRCRPVVDRSATLVRFRRRPGLH
jgi:hypothetical protein